MRWMASFVASSGVELFESDGQPGEIGFVRAVVRSRSPSLTGDWREATIRKRRDAGSLATYLGGKKVHAGENGGAIVGRPPIVHEPIEDFGEIDAALRPGP